MRWVDIHRRSLRQLLDVRGEQLAETGEARVLVQVRPRIPERAGNVLDVNRVAARDGLITERAERLQVALERHQIESPPVFLAGHALAVALLQRQKVGD